MTVSHDQGVAEHELGCLASHPLGFAAKGFAGIGPSQSITPSALVGGELAAGVYSTPLMVLKDSALEHNIRTLADYCASRGALMAPHAKTTMSPELFVRQLRAGAWGLTAANVTQAAVYVRFGARRVLIANQVTDPVAIDALVGLLGETPGLEVACYVDSLDAVELLDRELSAAGLAGRLPVLVERGLDEGGRTGVRSLEAGVAVARAAAATSTLAVVGTSCFEGSVGHGTDDETLAAVRAVLAATRELGVAIAAEGLVSEGLGGTGLVLSAGGSHYFDIVMDEFGAVDGARVVVRSGSYVTHDHSTYLASTPSMRLEGLAAFRPAIEVRVTVLSNPEPGLYLLNAGRRDVSFDSGWPIPLRAWRGGDAVEIAGATVQGLDDQHAYLHAPAGCALRVGDAVALGVSHPCTTFDKWRNIVVVDDDDRVTGIAHTFF